jgi:serine/threonine protein kinase
MYLLDFLRRKKRLLGQLLTEEASNNFVDAFYRKSEESPFKVGDTIHTERFGIPWGPFDVTGLKVGGQAIIYTVLADNGTSIYALKTFQNWCYRERGMFERFMREAEIVIDLGRHPNLLSAHAVFSINGRPYILLEYVAGSSLRQKLKSGALPIEDAIRYAIELCRGLSHAQAVLPTFIHRDIKPDNCLVTNDGVLKIGDFGQAKTSRSNVCSECGAHYAESPNSAFGSKTTLSGHWGAGTPEYMAPEQFRTDSDQDVRTDVYSFGVLLFELLTGQLPFTAKEHEEFFERHCSTPPPDLRSINSEIPGDLCELVSRCLAKSKEERPGDFGEIERELQRIRFDLFGAHLSALAIETEGAIDSFNRGLSLLHFQRYDETISCFERSSQNALKTRSALFTSVALGAKDRLDDAEKVIDRVLEESPKNSLALNQKGLLLRQRRRYWEAIQIFDQAIAVESKFVAAINNKAVCLIELGESARAIFTSKRSLAIDPLQNAAFRNLGEIYQQMNQRGQALDSYQKAVEADPRDVHSLVQLSNELMREGRYAEAIGPLEQAIWLAEGNLNKGHIRGETVELLNSGGERVLSLTGKDDSTIYQWFIIATHLNCLSSSSLRALSDDLIACFPRWRSWQRAELAKCLNELSERSESDYQSREFRHSIGRMFYELSRYDYSRAVFTALLESYGDDAQSLYYLAACNEMQGKEGKALEDS